MSTITTITITVIIMIIVPRRFEDRGHDSEVRRSQDRVPRQNTGGGILLIIIRVIRRSTTITTIVFIIRPRRLEDGGHDSEVRRSRDKGKSPSSKYRRGCCHSHDHYYSH